MNFIDRAIFGENWFLRVATGNSFSIFKLFQFFNDSFLILFFNLCPQTVSISYCHDEKMEGELHALPKEF